MSSTAWDDGGGEDGGVRQKRERKDQGEIKFFTLPQISVSLPYKQRAFIIYDNDVTLSLT